ncbi:MAG: DegV family protein [Bacilli bacterium]|jgi:DegV family protein with EDD domain|nr:DegV family protein [Bacilli bacterium]
MKKIHIITDSTSDISQIAAEKLGIDVVPMHVNIDGVDYIDGLTISNQDFFKKLRTAKILPRTSAPSPGAFLDVIKKYPQDEEILIMTISNDASATYSSARLAVDELERDNIVLYDTRQATLGLLALVHAAIQFRDVGDNAKTIVEKIQEISKRIVVQAAFDDLRYLRMGGRIPFTLAVLGSVINMKPIITMQDGKIHSAAKIIGMQRALNHIVYGLADTVVDDSLPAFVGHTDNPEMYKKFTDLIKIHKPDFPLDREASIGLAVGTHAGPGCVGIVYFTK